MPTSTDIAGRTEAFLGLAPFLRMSIAGTDFVPAGQEMLTRAAQHPDDANLWMNLATVMLCLEQRELGLSIQAQALALRRCYHWQASEQPARVRVLLLCVAGDLSANMPLDCLLERSDIDLIFYFVAPDGGFVAPVPDHDVVVVGISACDESAAALAALDSALAAWPKPVINPPRAVCTTERNAASLLLQQAPGLISCPALRVSRAQLADLAAGATTLAAQCPGCRYPVILRPVGSHGGRGLDKIDAPEDIAGYLAREAGEAFFLSQFVDYSGADGQFRKYRVALVEGQPFACHMAVSSHWMVHYVNADMYADAGKRAEEAAFMRDFAAFAEHHRAALAAISQRTGLDYVAIDCAETAEGELLVFEIDHAMVVHAMDLEALFPYKQIHMAKVKDAFRALLLRRAGVAEA